MFYVKWVVELQKYNVQVIDWECKNVHTINILCNVQVL